MRRARQSKLEVEVGIAEYAVPTTAGIGGVLKRLHTDFCVNEIDVAGEEVRLTITAEQEEENASDEAEATATTANEYDGESDDDVEGSYEPHRFVRFTLHKEKMDTLGAIASLSSHLGLPVRNFGFAGLKDHRAVTAQEMTVRDASISAVRAAHKHHPNCSIGHVRYVDRQLRLGELGGNRFRILLRGVKGSCDDINAALSALREHGFINYFGLQRFGEHATRNDEVGKCLMTGDYAAAVDIILGPTEQQGEEGVEAMGAHMKRRRVTPLSPSSTQEGSSSSSISSDISLTDGAGADDDDTDDDHDHDGGGGGGSNDVEHSDDASGGGGRRRRIRRVGDGGSAEAEAREAWIRSCDARTALKLMPRSKALEREVLGGMAHLANTGDCLPHAERCRLSVLGLPLGLRRLMVHSYFSRVFNVVASERIRRLALAPAQAGELVVPSARLLHGIGGPRRRRRSVHVVTDAEAEAGTFDAHQIVLPLPGTDVIMPKTPEGSLYVQMLRFDGIDPYAPALEAAAIRSGEAEQAALLEGEDEEDWEEAEEGEEDEVAVPGMEARGVDEPRAAEEEEGHEEWQADGVQEDEWNDEEWHNWFYLQGDYRALLLRPRQMEWAVVTREAKTSASTISRGTAEANRAGATYGINGNDDGSACAATATAEAARAAAIAAVETSHGLDETDVALQFDLPPGAYATMALREVIKARPPTTTTRHIRFDV